MSFGNFNPAKLRALSKPMQREGVLLLREAGRVKHAQRAGLGLGEQQAMLASTELHRRPDDYNSTKPQEPAE